MVAHTTHLHPIPPPPDWWRARQTRALEAAEEGAKAAAAQLALSTAELGKAQGEADAEAQERRRDEVLATIPPALRCSAAEQIEVMREEFQKTREILERVLRELKESRIA